MSDPLDSLTPQQRELFLRLRRKQDQAAAAPLAFAQQRCRLHQTKFPQSWLFNLPVVFRIRGILDQELLAETFDQLVQRHSVLRACLDESLPGQRVGPAPRLVLCSLAPGEGLAEAERRVGDWVKEPFLLEQGPLIRAYLLRLEARDQVLALVIHGFVADCFSARILLSDWRQLYSQRSLGASPDLPSLPFSFAELALSQSQRDLTSQRDFWRKELQGCPPAPCVQEPQIPAVERFVVSPEVQRRLTALAAATNSTLFMVLVTALQIAQQRASGAAEVTTGTVVSCRTQAHSESLVGPFANYITLRTPTQNNLEDWLSETRRVVARAQSHQDLPFESLYGPETAPPFAILFVLHQSATEDLLKLPGAQLERFDVVSVPTGFPVEISCVISGAGITTSLRFQPSQQDSELASQLRRLPQLLEELAELSPERVAVPAPASTTPPFSMMERIRQVVADLLDTEAAQLDVDQGFFALGLDSLRALSLRTQLEQELGLSLPAEALFDHPTCRQLADSLEAPQAALAALPPPPLGASTPVRWESLLTLLLLLLLPLPTLAGMARVGSKRLNENRRLAVTPQWQGLRPDRLQAFAGKFDPYWNDHFGFRATFIQTYARLMYSLGVSADPEILVGENGWFFDLKLTGSKLDSLYHPTDWSGTQRRLEQARDRLAEEGIQLLIAFTPEKDEVYLENLTPTYRQAMYRYLGWKPGLRDYLLAHSNLDVLDLTPAVLKVKPHKTVFQVTDRHWSAYGAYAGFVALREHLLDKFPNLPELTPKQLMEESRPWVGGEVRKIGLQGVSETQVELVNPNSRWRVVGVPLSALFGHEEVNKDYATQVNSPELPRAVVFRNSMCNRMQPFLSEAFSRVRYVHNQVASLAFANEDHPDVVVLLMAPAAQAGMPGTDQRLHVDEAMWKNLKPLPWQTVQPGFPASSPGNSISPAGKGWSLDLLHPLSLTVSRQQAGPSQVFVIDVISQQPAVCTLSWWQAGLKREASRALRAGANRLHWVLSSERSDFELNLPAGRFSLGEGRLAGVSLPDAGAPGQIPADDSDQAFLALAEGQVGQLQVDRLRLEYCNQYERMDLGPDQRVFRAIYSRPRLNGLFTADYFLRRQGKRWELVDRWVYRPDKVNRYCPEHPAVATAFAHKCPFCGSKMAFAGQLDLAPQSEDEEVTPNPDEADADSPVRALQEQLRDQPGVTVEGPIQQSAATRTRREHSQFYQVRLAGNPRGTRVTPEQAMVTCDCLLGSAPSSQAPVQVDFFLAREGGQWRLLASWMKSLPDFSCPSHPQITHPEAGNSCPFDGQTLVRKGSS